VQRHERGAQQPVACFAESAWQVPLTSVNIGGDGFGGTTGGETLLGWAAALEKLGSVMRDDVGVGGEVGIGDGVSDAEPSL
jgi:hypothetical protein